MAERVSAAQRARGQSVAEQHIQKYAHDHALWHKYVHNVELDPVQILRMDEMDLHPKTIDFSCRRTGKTANKELYNLKDNATHADQELGVVAPRQAQAQVNITYHTDAIRRSQMLQSYLMYKNGRRELSDLKYQFANRSRAEGYGVMSNADGGDMTSLSLEEIDDMPKDRLDSRFLLMLAGNRRLGASKSSKNIARVNITGVFKGADTLTDKLNSGDYYVIGALHGEAAREAIRGMIYDGLIPSEAVELESYSYPMPILNMPNAIKLGLVQGDFLEGLRGEMSEDEFIRQLLCVNTASRNLVWELYMRRALTRGLMTGWTIQEPMPGEQYRKRGVVTFGYDHLGHGEQPESSKSALVVLEQVAEWTVLRYCKVWPAGTDESIIKRDLVSLWRYFLPDHAFGDAYGVGLITSVNDDLWREGLTTIDRRTIGDGESTASTWPEWAFSPIPFEGRTKHQMAMAVREVYHSERMVVPYIDDQDMRPEAELADLRTLTRQLTNIRAEATKKSYATYKMANPKLGDDLFDAHMAAYWALLTRGAAVPATVLVGKRSRSQMLGHAAA